MWHKSRREIESWTVLLGYVVNCAETGWRGPPGGSDTRYGTPIHEAKRTRCSKLPPEARKYLIYTDYLLILQDKGGVYNNPELEMIAKEIQSLLSEKIQIEKEIQETEYNISLKNTEMNSLQGEYDTLSSTLKQLTNQKDVAQRRLDDLDAQVNTVLI